MGLVTGWVLGLAGSPWTLVVLVVVLAAGAFVSVLPSQSLVVALAALVTARAFEPLTLARLAALVVAAALGMWAGDVLVQAAARQIDTHAHPLFRSARLDRVRTWVRGRFDAHPVRMLIGGRLIPLGRLATDLVAADAGMRSPVFARLAMPAAVLWGLYAVGIGAAAGLWHGVNAIALAAIAVVVSIALGVVWQWWQVRRTAPAGAVSSPSR